MISEKGRPFTVEIHKYFNKELEKLITIHSLGDDFKTWLEASIKQLCDFGYQICCNQYGDKFRQILGGDNKGLYRIKSKKALGNIRVIFTIKDSKYILLHIFVRKGEESYNRALRLANNRKKEV